MFARRNGSRLKLNDTQKNFVIKRACSTNKSSISSLNTSNSSKFFQFEDKTHPEDGKLLDLLSENENLQKSHIYHLQMSSFQIHNDESVQQRYALSDDVNNPQLRRNITYNWHYHNDHQQHLCQDTVSFSFSIKKHGIKEMLRAKMVDWMIEVFGNYPTTTTSQTYFRAVGLLDAFLKKTSMYYYDGDVHLMGISCMFIASKLEDIYHIPLSDIVTRVGHNKFNTIKVKNMEQTILETLQFNVYFPTPLDYLQNLFYKCFSLNDNQTLQNIYETCIYILKMCMHDLHMLNFTPNLLSAAIVGYAVREYIDTKQENKKADNLKLNKQSQDSIVKIAKIDFNTYNECQKQIAELINTFKSKYPDLNNLEKFS
ncbi:unnamed protein product [Paramecium octaurelia]|uniref:Cyclin-like domain-containing protein n=1 Tax=Paramecium octaurelia TaxID=43137 RepID=A0A8S1XPT3_PAROT|nr:unnamed protein product [Paramecium octaurelia]